MEIHARSLYLGAERQRYHEVTPSRRKRSWTRAAAAAAASGDADISSSDYLSNLQFAGMLSFEVAKGRWSILSDILYVDFSDSNRDATIPGLGIGSGLQVNADTGLQAMIFEIAGAYSVYKGEQGNFDVLLGMRYAGIEGKIDLNAVGSLMAGCITRGLTESLNFYDPIVGFKGKFLFGKNWFMPYYFDIGGFSVDSDLTMQAYAAIGYRFTDWFSMSLGYRYLYYDFGNTKLVEDITSSRRFTWFCIQLLGGIDMIKSCRIF